MKQLRFLLGMLPLLALLLVGCEESTPETDTTKLWPAGNGEKYGYINKKGKMVIAANYDWAATFSCGYACVDAGGQQYFIDKKGKMQNGMSFDEAQEHFYNDYLVFALNGRCGLMNKKFDYQIQPIYSFLGNMRDGLACASLSEEKWGYVDKSGKMVIAEMYADCNDFIDGLGPVMNEGKKWGCVNRKGEYVVSPIYDYISPFSSSMAMFEKNGKWGFLNASGKEVIPAMYDDADSFFENNLAPVCRNDKWGYVNKKGDVVIPLSYDYAEAFSEGYAVVTSNGNDIVIDTKGNVVFTLPKDFVSWSFFHNGLLLICKIEEEFGIGKTEYRYVDTKGNMVYAWTENYDYYSYSQKSLLTKKKEVPSKHYSLGKRK